MEILSVVETPPIIIGIIGAVQKAGKQPIL